MVLLAFSGCLCTLVSSQAPPKAKIESDVKSAKKSKSQLVELPYSLLIDPRMEATNISSLTGYQSLNVKTRKPSVHGVSCTMCYSNSSHSPTTMVFHSPWCTVLLLQCSSLLLPISCCRSPLTVLLPPPPPP